ncbi:hypothetical protein [Paracoccus sp. KR1-242]|uniref:hypothetical protein n=1 Tax=Paracoccus sp. KR1-242 TaxID=3410028 RepID=UPI003C004326
MLYPTAGARLYIADAPTEWPGALPGAGWVEIGETEALGMIGVEWETAQALAAGCDDGARLLTVKSHQAPSPMQIVLANDPEDAGQIVLWRAARSPDHYPFRLVDANGSTRSWFALVTSLLEVFDGANSIMKLQADLLPTSALVRNAEA